MFFTDLIIYLALIGFVLYVTWVNNLWGQSKGSKKAKVETRRAKEFQDSKGKTLKRLARFEWLALNVGIKPSEYSIMEYKYKIDRLGIKSKYLVRNYKPLELIGFFRLIQMIGVFLLIVTLIVSGSPFALLFGALIFSPALFSMYATYTIDSEDTELERDFPDFYLVVHARLVRGTNYRIMPVLIDFINSLDSMNVGGEDKTVMKQFVMDLRNNIETYGDDGLAVTKLRDKYRSVMVINFCNLAVQAMNGVNNSDKLLAFKIELTEKRKKRMSKRADKLVKRGEYAIMAVYLILFQFLLLSFYAKFMHTGGGLGNIF